MLLPLLLMPPQLLQPLLMLNRQPMPPKPLRVLRLRLRVLLRVLPLLLMLMHLLPLLLLLSHRRPPPPPPPPPVLLLLRVV
jgi:hypothetical protein